MLAGVVFAGELELGLAAAMRAVGAALPISGEDVGAGEGATCPSNEGAMGAANDIGTIGLFPPDSFVCAVVFSWGVFDCGVGLIGEIS